MTTGEDDGCCCCCCLVLLFGNGFNRKLPLPLSIDGSGFVMVEDME